MLFESHDGGATWELNQAFWETSRRVLSGAPARAACACTRSRRWPGDPSRVALAISAVGVWLTDDGGADVAPREQGDVSRATCRRRPARRRSRSASTTCTARPTAARAALHAVPRRRLPLRRRGRELDVDRGRPAVRLRLPDGDGPRRPGQRLRHPTRRRHGPDDARGQACASTRRATQARAGSSAATACRRTTRISRFSGRRSAARARARSMGLYFGATSGDVFGSGDAGRSWFTAATKLRRCTRCARRRVTAASHGRDRPPRVPAVRNCRANSRTAQRLSASPRDSIRVGDAHADA